jgi:fermentation-respiration switch protein FrsA (DUF1100 family)
VAALGAGSYLGVILVLLAFENSLVYYPIKASEEWQSPPADAVEDVALTSTDGTPIHAWWWPSARSSAAVLYCHGNAGNLSGRGPTLAGFHEILGVSVLIFDYPGYGKSGGRPSEQGCYQAADAAYDWLVHSAHIDPNEIIICGDSLGGGVAVDLASRKKHRALVLVKTFTSLPDVARRLYPWLPVRWLMRNRFDNLGKIDRCRQPVLVAHGPEDQLVPFVLGERLFAAANEPKKFVNLEHGAHNDPLPLEFFQQLQSFLAETAHHEPAPAKN